MQKTKEYTKKIVENAKQASAQQIAQTATAGQNIIKTTQLKVHQIIEDQKKKIEKLEQQKVSQMDMQQKRYQQIENLRLQRRNFNSAKRIEQLSQKAGPQTNSQANPDKIRQEKFKLCTQIFRGTFEDLKSAVFNEFYEADKFQSPEICDSVPKTAFLGKSECYEDLVNMFLVLVKEVKVFLDPKSKPQYSEQVVDINRYSEQIKQISQNCIENFLQGNSDEPSTDRSISNDCQAAHRQALSQLGSLELADELPFDQFTLVSSGLEFAFDGNNLKLIEENCTN